jgi:hypothetical protein
VTTENVSNKGAFRLGRLGFKVKELIGGLEHWKSDGFRTESGAELDSITSAVGST